MYIYMHAPFDCSRVSSAPRSSRDLEENSERSTCSSLSSWFSMSRFFTVSLLGDHVVQRRDRFGIDGGLFKLFVSLDRSSFRFKSDGTNDYSASSRLSAAFGLVPSSTSGKIASGSPVNPANFHLRTATPIVFFGSHRSTFPLSRNPFLPSSFLSSAASVSSPSTSASSSNSSSSFLSTTNYFASKVHPPQSHLLLPHGSTEFTVYNFLHPSSSSGPSTSSASTKLFHSVPEPPPTASSTFNVTFMHPLNYLTISKSPLLHPSPWSQSSSLSAFFFIILILLS